MAESHGSAKLMAVGDEDGLVKLQRPGRKRGCGTARRLQKKLQTSSCVYTSRLSIPADSGVVLL